MVSSPINYLDLHSTLSYGLSFPDSAVKDAEIC